MQGGPINFFREFLWIMSNCIFDKTIIVSMMYIVSHVKMLSRTCSLKQNFVKTNQPTDQLLNGNDYFQQVLREYLLFSLVLWEEYSYTDLSQSGFELLQCKHSFPHLAHFRYNIDKAITNLSSYKKQAGCSIFELSFLICKS